MRMVADTTAGGSVVMQSRERRTLASSGVISEVRVLRRKLLTVAAAIVCPMGSCSALRRWLPAALLLAMLGCVPVAFSPVRAIGPAQAGPCARPQAGHAVGSHEDFVDRVTSSSSAAADTQCTDAGYITVNSADLAPSPAGAVSTPREAAVWPGPPPFLTATPDRSGATVSPVGLLLAELSVRRT
jgi:hypothetical protein